MEYKFIPMNSTYVPMINNYHSVEFFEKKIPKNWHGVKFSEKFALKSRFNKESVTRSKWMKTGIQRSRLVIRKVDVLKDEKIRVFGYVSNEAVKWLNALSGKYMFSANNEIFFEREDDKILYSLLWG